MKPLLTIWGLTGALLLNPIATAELADRNPIQPTAAPLPAGLTVADWGQIRREYERHRHSAVPDGEGYKARNHYQDWLIRFDGRGFLVEPDEDKWNWGLSLTTYGREGAQQTVDGKATITADKNRVTYTWDETVDEWFINDTRGLEHGFTIHRRPQGEGEHLRLQLTVRGDLHAEAVDGQTVGFVNAAGGNIVNYTGLKVWDAAGQPLPAWLEAPASDQVRLVLNDQRAKYPITVDPIAQEAYLKASNTDPSDFFGQSVDISGDTIVIGAPNERSNGVGVNPSSQADNSLIASGAVYVFVRTAGMWSQQAYLKASNTEEDDRFGRSVAISGDTIVVGAVAEDSSGIGVNPLSQSDNNADFSGAAYVFARTAGVWSQQAYLKASNTGSGDQFGGSVDISGDTVLIGATGEKSNGVGVNSLSQTNNSLIAAGAAYVFTRTAGVWSQQAYLKASNTEAQDLFGAEVAISDDTVVVSATGEDGNGVGVNPASQADNSADGSGAVYIFSRTGSVWSQQAYLKASNTDSLDFFGSSVAISGDTVVVSTNGEDSSGIGVNPPSQADNSAEFSGAAYVFTRTDGVWSQQAYLKASNTEAEDLFGTSVAISGDTLVVGATGEDSDGMGVNPASQADNSAQHSGAAYVFVRRAEVWSQQAYLKASNNDAFDSFAGAVAVSDGTAVVGARLEASNGVGANPPTQSDNSSDAAGAVYAFTGLLPPIAEAGPDQLLHIPAGETANVTLDGTGSLAPEGLTLTLTWTGPFPEGGGTVQGETAMVTLPPGAHTVTLTVDDGDSPVDVDTVDILVNQLPEADAGPDQGVQVPVGDTMTVTLDGSGSSDPEAEPLIYTWTGPFPEGAGTVTGETEMVTLGRGVNTITLTVEDTMGGTDNDTVDITVELLCPANLTYSDDTLSGTRTLEATTSVTLGPNLTIDGTDITVISPTLNILGGTSITGTFSVSNNPACP